MDTLGSGRYAEVMQSLRILFILAGSMLVCTTDVAVANDAPVLAVLEYRGGLLPKRAEIRSINGTIKSPYPNLPRKAWTLREGDTLKQEYPPQEVVIHFLRSIVAAPEEVCSVVVRYARTDKGWRPTYLLLQEQPPLVTWSGGKFVPIPSSIDARQSIQIINPTAPNTSGFYSPLGFGLLTGHDQINGWTVQ